MEATSTHRFLTSKFQVGSAKSDKINFSLAQKVFHSGDVPKAVLEAKRTVLRKKQANILGVEPSDWNSSTLAESAGRKEERQDLKRQLLKVRAGLMDERLLKPSKSHSDEAMAERYRFIVAVTGQGPMGKLTGKWFNTVDERGLAKHCIQDDWPDWNNSTSAHTPEDIKRAKGIFERKEARRLRQAADMKLDPETYVNPTAAVANINDRLRERKIDFQDLKAQFKRELKVEFPQASEERLQAMAQRLLNEKLLADEKMARFPVQNECFRPNLSLTTQDRRYKEYSHPGAWLWSESEKRHAFTCCLNFDKDSRGCECRIVNPDSWCYAGFERI